MAEGGGLENRCVSNGTGGSNPSPSARPISPGLLLFELGPAGPCVALESTISTLGVHALGLSVLETCLSGRKGLPAKELIVLRDSGVRIPSSPRNKPRDREDPGVFRSPRSSLGQLTWAFDS